MSLMFIFYHGLIAAKSWYTISQLFQNEVQDTDGSPGSKYCSDIQTEVKLFNENYKNPLHKINFILQGGIFEYGTTGWYESLHIQKNNLCITYSLSISAST